MNRRLLWTALAAAGAVALVAPLLASAQARPSQDPQGALAEHKAQEQRERDEEAARAKRREAARTGQDGREKTRAERAGEEEEEERARR